MTLSSKETFRIQESEPVHRASIIALLSRISQELWGLSLDDLHELDPLSDLEQPHQYYREHGGIFLVLLRKESVIGTGGIVRMDDQAAEMKRVFLRKEYRGRGLGKRLVEELIDFCRGEGFRKIRLEVAAPEVQVAALGLYSKMGFKEIPRYQQSACSCALEKALD